ncbi:alpha/beta fold hydrolase [Flavobacterium saccharophilum]|uniref:Pimeloyl-ACP methyl ester carboxylesterase n=1 Tax=Flavobacterium saccharophilum TaxID=29534 RepID=A0A1M7LC60_9FLAO|nr:alpha/beta hydrolase [Flavobacterium saccharophilum]SHM75709.1 Pimeloyl-ACP methyl ester carboxylesterase [Flavobacterium saccharophilum]
MKTLKISFVFLMLITNLYTMNAQKSSALNSTTEFADVPGRKIAYRSIGQGTPIILVNRFRGTLDTWDPLFLDKLADNYRVITFDYSGIGYSTGTLPTDLKEVAKDVKDLAAFLKIEKTIIMGWSYGGLVTQVATLLFDDLITQTVLLGTGPPGERVVPLGQAFLDAALKPVNDFDDEIVLFFEPSSEASKIEAKASHDRIAKRIDVSKIPSTMDVFQLYFQGSAGLAEDKDDFKGKLKTTKTPILIICGDNDISFAVENWYPLTQQLPTAQLIVLPQTGHAPHHQHVNLVVNYIHAFLENSK